MPSSRSGNAANIQRKAHAAAAEGDRDALVALLAPPKTCSWSWWSRGSKGPDLIDPATGDTLLHSAARCLEPSSSCRALVGELLSGSEHLPCIDARSVNFQLETPLHVALFERRVAPAEVLLEHAASRLGGSGEADALALLNAKDIHNWTALDAAADGALWGLAGRLCALGASPQNCGRFVRASAPALAFPASVAEAAAQRAGAGAAGSSVLTAIFEAAKAQAKTASIRVQESRIERMAAERADTRMSAHAFRSTDEVLSWRAEAIARVAEALCIPPEEAERALKEAAWDEPRLLSEWRGPAAAAARRQRAAAGGASSSSAALCGAAGQAGGPAVASPTAACVTGTDEADTRDVKLQPAAAPAAGGSPEQPAAAAQDKGKAVAAAQDRDADRDDECLVCFEPVPQGPGSLRLACRHAVCAECWASHVRARCDEGDVVRGVRCPAGFCGEAAAPRQLAAVVPVEVLSRLERLSAQAFVDTAPGSMRWCPRAGCAAVVRLQFAENGRDYALDAVRAGRALDASCPACGEAFCWSCGGAAHEPAACAHVRGWAALARSAEADAAAFSQEWVARNTKPCPVCKNAIEKNSGCNHLSCRCGHQFCWVCMKPWSLHSGETGGSWLCMLADEANARAAAGSGSGAGPSGAAQRSQMAPQVIDELQAAVASSQRYDADAYAPLHASLARAARIADESAAMAVTGRVTAAAPEPGAGEGAAASGSVTSDVVGQKLRAWRVEQEEWASTLRSADSALKDCMRAVSNAHIYIWHMAPGPQRVYVSHLLASLQAAADILMEAARLLDRGQPDELPSGRHEAGAPVTVFSALQGLFSFARAPSAFLRDRAREQALREAERRAIQRRSADAGVFFRGLALRARRAEVEAAARAGRAGLERLLFCVRSGAVKAPPQHWARGRSATGAAARAIASAAGSVVDSALWVAGRFAGFVASRLLTQAGGGGGGGGGGGPAATGARRAG